MADLFDLWLFADTHRTYHEWVEWRAAELDAWEEADRRAAALALVRQQYADQLAAQQAAQRATMEAAYRLRIEERLSQIPAMFVRDDAFLIGDVWRSRADIIAHPPEWWWDESAPTLLSPRDLARRMQSRVTSSTFGVVANYSSYYSVGY